MPPNSLCFFRFCDRLSSTVSILSRFSCFTDAEITSRTGISFMLMQTGVFGAYTRYVADQDGAGLNDALSLLWAEASAVRAADRVFIGGMVEGSAREVIQGYGMNREVMANVSPWDFSVHVKDLSMHTPGLIHEPANYAYHRTSQVWRGDLDADEIRAIREGAWSYQQLIDWAESENLALSRIVEDKSYLVADKPDREAIDRLCAELVSEFHGWSHE